MYFLFVRYFTKVMLLFSLGILSLSGVQAQVAMGNYAISGTANIGNDGINLNIKALRIGSGGPTPIPGEPSPTPIPSPVPGGASKMASDEVYRGLDKHNAYREIHRAQPMALSSELNNNAQTYANYLVDNSLFEHSPNLNNEGENLGLQCASGTDGDLVEKVVEAWYMEVCNYRFDDQGFSGGTGHFTQMVWKGSTQLGIGFARGSYTFGSKTYDNCLFVVSRYRPPGNMMDDFQNNVEKGSFNKAETCSNNAGKRNRLANKLLKRISKKNEKAHKRVFTLIL